MKLVLLATNHQFVKILAANFDKLHKWIVDSGKTGWSINKYMLIGRPFNVYNLYLNNINNQGEITNGLLSLNVVNDKIQSGFLDVDNDDRFSNTNTYNIFKRMYENMLVDESHSIIAAMYVLHIHHILSLECEELIIDIKMYIINILVDLFINKYSYKSIPIKNYESIQVSKTQ